MKGTASAAEGVQQDQVQQTQVGVAEHPQEEPKKKTQEEIALELRSEIEKRILAHQVRDKDDDALLVKQTFGNLCGRENLPELNVWIYHLNNTRNTLIQRTDYDVALYDILLELHNRYTAEVLTQMKGAQDGPHPMQEALTQLHQALRDSLVKYTPPTGWLGGEIKDSEGEKLIANLRKMVQKDDAEALNLYITAWSSLNTLRSKKISDQSAEGILLHFLNRSMAEYFGQMQRFVKDHHDVATKQFMLQKLIQTREITEQVEKEKADVERRVEDLATANAELESKKEALDQQKVAAEEKVKVLAAANQELTSKTDELTEKKAEAEGKVIELGQTKAELEAQLQTKQAEFASSSQALQAKQKEVEERQAELDAQKGRLTEVTAALAREKTEAEKQQQALLREQQQLATVTQQLAEQKAEVGSHKQRLGEVTADLTREKAEAERQRQALLREQQQLATVLQQLGERKAEIDSHKQQLAEVSEALAREREEAERQKKSVALKRQEVDLITQQLEQTKLEVKKQTFEHERYTESLRRANLELGQANEDLQRLKEKAERAKAEAEAAAVAAEKAKAEALAAAAAAEADVKVYQEDNEQLVTTLQTAKDLVSDPNQTANPAQLLALLEGNITHALDKSQALGKSFREPKAHPLRKVPLGRPTLQSGHSTLSDQPASFVRQPAGPISKEEQMKQSMAGFLPPNVLKVISNAQTFLLRERDESKKRHCEVVLVHFLRLVCEQAIACQKSVSTGPLLDQVCALANKEGVVNLECIAALREGLTVGNCADNLSAAALKTPSAVAQTIEAAYRERTIQGHLPSELIALPCEHFRTLRKSGKTQMDDITFAPPQKGAEMTGRK